jgi:uncharacterized protein YcnI
MMKRRKLAVAGLAAGFIVLLAAPAFAHVEIDPQEAEQGSTVTLTFTVPSERPVSTTKIDVKLPDDHPIADATATPKPGWTFAVERAGANVSTMTWSGGEIGPNQSDTFAVTLGPLPTGVDAISFPTIQTYADGVEVAWIQDTPAGGAEPANPAPVLKLAPPTTSSTTTTVAPSSNSAAAPTVTVAGSSNIAAAKKSDDGNGLLIAIAIIIVLVAVIIGGYAARNRRRRSA